VSLRLVRLFGAHGPAEEALLEEPVEGAAFSRDGQELAVSLHLPEGGSALRVIHLGPREQRALPLPGDATEGALAWTSDHELLVPVAGAHGTQVVLVNVRGGDGLAPRAFGLPVAMPSQPGAFALAPDGRLLAVVSQEGRPRGLLLIDTEGSAQARVGELDGSFAGALSFPSFSPDSRHVAATLTVCAQADCRAPVRAVVVLDTAHPERVAFVEFGSRPVWQSTVR
jgi:hypothetical protein